MALKNIFKFGNWRNKYFERPTVPIPQRLTKQKGEPHTVTKEHGYTSTWEQKITFPSIAEWSVLEEPMLVKVLY